MRIISFLFLSTLSFLSFSQNPGGGVIDFDGNAYSTVIIGNQEWMAENLRTSTFSNGAPILNITDPTYWGIASESAQCYYNNSPINDSIYGKLYNWYVIEDTNNVCPTGWHVPSIDEWTEMVNFLGGDLIAGGKIKEAGLNHWQSPNFGATNESGFNALPGGYRSNFSGTFSTIEKYGFWWSSTPQDANAGFIYYLHYDQEIASLATGNNKDGQSIRCIKATSQSGNIELKPENHQLIKIIDLMGRETQKANNTTLIYIFSDGSTERVFINE